MGRLLSGPPPANRFQRILGSGFLKLAGWKAVGNMPDIPKFVMILAPHTSNWDLFFMLAILYSQGIKFYWLGNIGFFRWPTGRFFKWLGGIPVDPNLRQNMVQQTVELISTHEQIIIGISPEGTRDKTKYWKTGFYYIARQARIPIVCAFLDYGRRVGGLGPTVLPSGSIEKDMTTIRRFYGDITAKHPANFEKIAIIP